jgi:hypothetical protein
MMQSSASAAKLHNRRPRARLICHFFPARRFGYPREALASRRTRSKLKERDMKLVESIDRASLEQSRLVAESSEFAIFEMGQDTYALVHRHEAVAWQGIMISGDGLFRVAELVARATRALYRDVAGELSKERNR